MNKTKTIILGILFVAIAMITGVTFALWQTTLTQQSTNIITSGCFKVELTDENPITLGNAYPITDVEGSSLTPYTFTITNTCNSLVGYQVNLEVLNSSSLLRTEYVKAKLNDGIPLTLSSDHQVVKTLENARSSYGMEVGSLGANETKTFQLRLWLDENTPASDEVMDKTLNSKVTITLAHEKDMYADNSLNGANPVISEGLVPVTIDANGTVHKADTSKEWYNYTKKEWANAIILKDESVEYQNEEVISEDNIESYFVWIPRYRYKIFNDTLYDGLTAVDDKKIQTIEIEFESKYMSPSNGTKNDEWLTHPAFTSFDTNGFWVGKFETSKSNVAPDNSINAVGVQIKPNVSSWRNINVGNMFYTSYYYNRNLDSHMMKNMEWGAVAYLQHSKYGSQANVRINNNSSFITGYASVNEPTCGYTATNEDCHRYGTTSDITQPYNTETGVLASTTGNITGIYDMAGSSWEYVMGIMVDQNGNPLSGRNANNNSGFVGNFGEGGSLDSGYSWPEEKYYDKYQYGTSESNYTRRILGDATGEVGSFEMVSYGSKDTRHISSWYNNQAFFLFNLNPWFMRGGASNTGSESGVFAFDHGHGSVYPNGSFRLVITP